VAQNLTIPGQITQRYATSENRIFSVLKLGPRMCYKMKTPILLSGIPAVILGSKNNGPRF